MFQRKFNFIERSKPRNSLRLIGERGMLFALFDRTLRDLGIIVDIKSEGKSLNEENFNDAKDWVLYDGPPCEHGFTAAQVFDFLGYDTYYLNELRRRLRH